MSWIGAGDTWARWSRRAVGDGTTAALLISDDQGAVYLVRAEVSVPVMIARMTIVIVAIIGRYRGQTVGTVLRGDQTIAYRQTEHGVELRGDQPVGPVAAREAMMAQVIGIVLGA